MTLFNARFASRAALSICALTLLAGYATPATGATLSRSVDVSGTPAAVWEVIGPFCAIKDWHPAIGTCTQDAATPPTRTLVTKDGKATFVETQTARSDARYLYSYTFKSSPLPVTNYASTIAVTAKGDGMSTVTWSSSFTPDIGKEKDAADALTGIYDAGLGAIKARLAK